MTWCRIHSYERLPAGVTLNQKPNIPQWRAWSLCKTSATVEELPSCHTPGHNHARCPPSAMERTETYCMWGKHRGQEAPPSGCRRSYSHFHSKSQQNNVPCCFSCLPRRRFPRHLHHIIRRAQAAESWPPFSPRATSDNNNRSYYNWR